MLCTYCFDAVHLPLLIVDVHLPVGPVSVDTDFDSLSLDVIAILSLQGDHYK